MAPQLNKQNSSDAKPATTTIATTIDTATEHCSKAGQVDGAVASLSLVVKSATTSITASYQVCDCPPLCLSASFDSSDKTLWKSRRRRRRAVQPRWPRAQLQRVGAALLLLACSAASLTRCSLTLGSPNSLAASSQGSQGTARNGHLAAAASSQPLRVSVTPRVAAVRVPANSNALLKCLISTAPASRLRESKVQVRWSRLLQSSGHYEQLPPSIADSANSSRQLADLLSRSRQEVSFISELLVEASLAVQATQPSDNATYFCAALADNSGELDRAQIDLCVLSRPTVKLDGLAVAKDGKSALINWLVVSDGNAPIKKTILMIRNESLGLPPPPPLPARGVATNLALQQSASQQPGDAQGQNLASQSALLITDADNNQWHRFDIAGDGQAAQYSAPVGVAQANSVAASQQHNQKSNLQSDADITSLSDYNARHNSRISGSSSSAAATPALLSKRRSFNLTSLPLLPGLTYKIRLAAINDLGQSEWSHISASYANEIPAQIVEVFLLWRAVDSLAVGWRRPHYDRAKTLRYEMQLFDLNRTLTLDAYTAATSSPQAASNGSARVLPDTPAKTNFMYIFVNLNAGTDYHFHVRACAREGCSHYSRPKLLASTLDGEPEAPVELELHCGGEAGASTPNANVATQQQQRASSAGDLFGMFDAPARHGGKLASPSISWLPPLNARGQLTNFTVTLRASAVYVNESGILTSVETIAKFETADNITLSSDAFLTALKAVPAGSQTAPLLPPLVPNTNYSASVCASNRATRCGQQSLATARSSCSTAPELPANLDLLPFKLRSSLANGHGLDDELPASSVNADGDGSAGGQSPEELTLRVPRVSQRNGTLDCIQIVLIKLVPAEGGGGESSLAQLMANLPEERHKILIEKFDRHEGDDDDEASRETKPQQQASRQLGYHAHIAEELELSTLSTDALQSSSVVASAFLPFQLKLGDGRQQICSSISVKLPNDKLSGAKRRVFDAGLESNTYYTGFARFVLVRPASGHGGVALSGLSKRATSNAGAVLSTSQSAAYHSIESQATPGTDSNALREQRRRHRQQQVALAHGQKFETLVGYSNYFAPVKTSSNELQVPASSEPSDLSATLTSFSSSAVTPLSQATSKLLAASGHYISATIMPTLGKYYNITAAGVARVAQMESVREFIAQSSPLAQLLEVGFIVVSVTLAALFVVYVLRFVASCGGARSKATAGPDSSSAPNVKKQKKAKDRKRAKNAKTTADGKAALDTKKSAADNSEELQRQQQAQAQVQMQAQHAAAQFSTGPAHQHIQFIQQQQQQQCAQPQLFEQQMPQPQPPPPLLQDASTPPSHALHQCPVHATPLKYQQPVEQRQVQQQTLVSYDRNCRTVGRRRGHSLAAAAAGLASDDWQLGQHPQRPRFDADSQSQSQNQNHAHNQAQYSTSSNMTLSQQQTLSTLACAKKFNRPVPVTLLAAVFECRARNGWLRDEFEALSRPSLLVGPTQHLRSSSFMRLSEELRVGVPKNGLAGVELTSKQAALLSGSGVYDANLVDLASSDQSTPSHCQPLKSKRRFICAKSPLDADSVWDFWRLIYEQNVGVIVMLTQIDGGTAGASGAASGGDSSRAHSLAAPVPSRCAQYWPTCDNEETTILSPCNEFVQRSALPAAKFKIRQDTLAQESRAGAFTVRQLTLILMASSGSESKDEGLDQAGVSSGDSNVSRPNKANDDDDNDDDDDDDDERFVIEERQILHIQYHHWNTATLNSQLRLLNFIDFVNSKTVAPSSDDLESLQEPAPILVHCSNGLGRSGVFVVMSYLMEDLSLKLAEYLHGYAAAVAAANGLGVPRTPQAPKANIFSLVAKCRQKREMLVSPQRCYELLYHLTANYVSLAHKLGGASVVAANQTSLQG